MTISSACIYARAMPTGPFGTTTRSFRRKATRMPWRHRQQSGHCLSIGRCSIATLTTAKAASSARASIGSRRVRVSRRRVTMRSDAALRAKSGEIEPAARVSCGQISRVRRKAFWPQCYCVRRASGRRWPSPRNIRTVRQSDGASSCCPTRPPFLRSQRAYPLCAIGPFILRAPARDSWGIRPSLDRAR